MLKIHLYIFITDHFLTMKINLHLNVSLNISEASELLEVSPEGIASVIKGLISSTNEAASLDNIMSLVKGRGCEVFIDWMDFKSVERINRSDRMLPNISNNIKEIASFE